MSLKDMKNHEFLFYESDFLFIVGATQRVAAARQTLCSVSASTASF